MLRSSKLDLVAAALAAMTLAATPAHAEDGSDDSALPAPTGTGRALDAAHGMCLDLAGWGARGDSNVLLGACSGDLDQRWKLVPPGRGTFELQNTKRGLCLDVDVDADADTGARSDNVLLRACDSGADLLWTSEPYAAPAHLVQDPAPQSPGPVGLPQHQPMEDGAFRSLVTSVNNESFSEDQLEVVEEAATDSHFRVAQVKTLIDTVPFSATKLRVLELCAPHIVDSENVFTMFDAFTFGADKDQARQILRRNGF